MKATMRGLAVAAALAGFCGTAQAALFTLSGGTVVQDTSNEFAVVNQSPPAVCGALVNCINMGGTLSASSAASVRIDYIGREAGDTDNQFWWNGFSRSDPGAELLFSTGPGGGTTGDFTGLPPTSLASVFRSVSAGAIPMLFYVPTTDHEVENGHAHAVGDLAFIFTDAAGNKLPFAGGGDIVYVMLDDAGTPDDNHDDMIMRISAVPEPATLGVLGLALAGFGVARRRKG